MPGCPRTLILGRNPHFSQNPHFGKKPTHWGKNADSGRMATWGKTARVGKNRQNSLIAFQLRSILAVWLKNPSVGGHQWLDQDPPWQALGEPLKQT